MATVRPNLQAHLLVKDDVSDVICSTGFAVLRVKPKKADPAFLYFHLFSEPIANQINALIAGSNYPAISAGDVKRLHLPAPELEEQQAIAAALSDADDLIRSLEMLIAKKRDIKQAAMQLLLTGKKRLPGFKADWRDTELSRLGAFSKGRGISKAQVSKHGLPCVRYGEIYTTHQDFIREFVSYISPGVAKTSQRLRKGDLLFTGSGETAEEIGKCVAYLKDEEAYAGGDIVILSPTNCDSLFLGYLLNYRSVVQQKVRMAQGDAVVHISATNLGAIQLNIPEPDEQSAIAQVLFDIDSEVDMLEARRDKTCAIKQAMMQQLLTGKVRLV
jgi:type I restriction enzyme S subunit